MNYKTIVIPVLLVIIGYFMYKKIRTKDIQNNQFVVGTAAGYAPFVSVNPVGEYEGFDIDVAYALAQNMGKELVIKDLGSMTSLFMALEQGSIDAIIWGLSITQDRLQRVAMIHYQGETTTAFPLMFWKQIPAGIAGLQDMRGMTICVEPTSSQDTVLSTYEDIIKLPTERVDDALLNLHYGKAQAAFVEPAIAKKFKNKYPEIQILEIPLKPENQVFGIGITIKKTNTALITQVQQAVAQLSEIIKTYACTWGIE